LTRPGFVQLAPGEAQRHADQEADDQYDEHDFQQGKGGLRQRERFMGSSA